MKRRSEIPVEGPPVSDGEAAVLIGGWGAQEPPDATHGHGFGFLGIWLWSDGDAGLANAWQRHEGYLRDLAQRWKWQPEFYVAPANEHGLRFVCDRPRARPVKRDDAGPYFYAEALAIAGPQRL